jgi:hypothetical protein
MLYQGGERNLVGTQGCVWDLVGVHGVIGSGGRFVRKVGTVGV